MQFTLQHNPLLTLSHDIQKVWGDYGPLVGFVAGVVLCAVVYGSMRRAQLRRDQASLKALKDQFVALCSHYLLTPVSVIQAAVGALQEKGSDIDAATRDRFYDAIQRGQQRIWILAEQFLLVMQIEEGAFRLNPAVGDFAETVSAAVTAMDSFSREKSITVQLSNPGRLEIREARFDARRLKQALIAILDNAIKFTPEGGKIGIAIGLENDILQVAVADTGIGMSENVIAHLSEKFFRGTSTYNFDYEGIGLGLYIAEAIIQEHEGTISYDSRPSQGTTVTVQFPKR